MEQLFHAVLICFCLFHFGLVHTWVLNMKIAYNTKLVMHFFSQINGWNSEKWLWTFCMGKMNNSVGKWKEAKCEWTVWYTATTVTAATLHCNFVYCVFVVKIIYTCINLHLESSYIEKAKSPVHKCNNQYTKNKIDKTLSWAKHSVDEEANRMKKRASTTTTK